MVSGQRYFRRSSSLFCLLFVLLSDFVDRNSTQLVPPTYNSQLNSIIPFSSSSSRNGSNYHHRPHHSISNPEEILESQDVQTIDNDIILEDLNNTNSETYNNSNDVLDDDDGSQSKHSEFFSLISPPVRQLKPKLRRKKREVNLGKKWPSHIIPYEVDPDGGFLKNETAILRDVFDEFEKYTCIRFVPHTDEHDYLYIRSVESRGCLSYIGHQGGRQDIFLRRPNCLYYPGTVMHETMHSIGFYHEHSRPDRENYIDILYDNIKPEKLRNFDVEPRALSLGSPYDYLSLMHYSALTFSVDADHLKYTIVPKKPAVPVDELGQRRGFSQVDIEQIRRFYECDEDEHDLKNNTKSDNTDRQGRKVTTVVSTDSSNDADLLCDNTFVPTSAINFFGSVFLFRGSQYWKLEYDGAKLSFKSAKGYPRSNEVGWGAGTPSDPHAAFTYYLFVYMFKDRKGWILGPNRPAKGPLSFDQLFPRLPQNINWDAAFTRGNWIHFIKERQYWQQELLTDELLGPLQLPSNFPTHIDAMTELADKRIMLISGNSVYVTQLDDVTKFESGFPRSLVELVCAGGGTPARSG